MNVQTGIGFMKKSFLTIKIEGAKLIDAACKQALTNFSFTNSPNHEKYQKNIEHIMQVLS
jgi:hypothetical protein